MSEILKTTAQVLDVISAATSVDRDNLLAPSRGTARSAESRMLAYWLLRHAGHRNGDIARIFGRDENTIRHGIRKVRANRRNSREWAALTDMLIENLQIAQCGLDIFACRGIISDLADAIESVCNNPDDTYWRDRAALQAGKARERIKSET